MFRKLLSKCIHNICDLFSVLLTRKQKSNIVEHRSEYPISNIRTSSPDLPLSLT